MYPIMLSENEENEIITSSRNALKKIKSEKLKEVDHIREISDISRRVNMGSELFEAFDMLAWDGKVRIDMLYYDQFLQKLEESEEIYKALGIYFKTIREIYEFVNLKPEIYGKGIDYTILEHSAEFKKQKVSNIIYEYLDKNFYSLKPEQRTSRYLENSRELSKELITEGISPEESMIYATKVVLIENLLTKIAFPFAIKSRINYLLESEDYGKVFDRPALLNLVDSFNLKVYSLAKVISAVV